MDLMRGDLALVVGPGSNPGSTLESDERVSFSRTTGKFKKDGDQAASPGSRVS